MSPSPAHQSSYRRTHTHTHTTHTLTHTHTHASCQRTYTNTFPTALPLRANLGTSTLSNRYHASTHQPRSPKKTLHTPTTLLISHPCSPPPVTVLRCPAMLSLDYVLRLVLDRPASFLHMLFFLVHSCAFRTYAHVKHSRLQCILSALLYIPLSFLRLCPAMDNLRGDYCPICDQDIRGQNLWSLAQHVWSKHNQSQLAQARRAHFLILELFMLPARTSTRTTMVTVLQLLRAVNPPRVLYLGHI